MTYIAIPLSSLFFCIILAAYILWTDRKNIASKFFALQIFSAAFWIFCNFMADIAKTAASNLFWSRMTLAGAALVIVFLYFFSLYFPKEKPSKPAFKYIVLFFSLLIIVLSPTELNIDSVYPLGGGFGINTGFLYLPFLFYFALTAATSVFNFIHRADTQTEKAQAKFVITGIVISIILGFVTNAVLPVLGISQYVSFGAYFSGFFLIFTFYAIIKHQLFNIKVIATELFLLVLWIILLIRIFLYDNASDLIINIGVFASIVFVGILLVRSVIKEVEQREKMEDMAKELEGAYVIEKKANLELQNLDKYKDDFLRQAQHDLKNPLTVIMGYSDLLLSGNFGKIPKKGTDILKRMQVVAQDKIKDVNNFLDTEQFKMGKKVVNLKPGVELLPILKEIAERLEYQAELKGIYLKLELPEKDFIVSADREKLKSALFNVVDNSVKYTQVGGVNIRVENNGPVKIIISDTGIGIPRDKIKSIFEAQFERTKEAQKTASGSGVGLYLSSQIIKLHNGKIWVESEGEGNGSTFYVELPQGQAEK